MNTLLKLLKKNARISNAELALLLDTDEKTIEKEIALLEASGVIRGYSAITNDDMIDEDFVTAHVELKVTPRSQSGFDEIACIVSAYEEVESCWLMSGAYDLAVTITGRNIRDISQFIAQRLASIDGVLSTATHFVLKRYKDNGIVISCEEIDERGFVSP